MRNFILKYCTWVLIEFKFGRKWIGGTFYLVGIDWGYPVCWTQEDLAKDDPWTIIEKYDEKDSFSNG